MPRIGWLAAGGAAKANGAARARQKAAQTGRRMAALLEGWEKVGQRVATGSLPEKLKLRREAKDYCRAREYMRSSLQCRRPRNTVLAKTAVRRCETHTEHAAYLLYVQYGSPIREDDGNNRCAVSTWPVLGLLISARASSEQALRAFYRRLRLGRTASAGGRFAGCFLNRRWPPIDNGFR